MLGSRHHAEGAFEHLRHDDLDNAVSDVVTHAVEVFVGLLELGKIDMSFPAALARYGLEQPQSDRRAGRTTQSARLN
jgi:hypothetical protein